MRCNPVWKWQRNCEISKNWVSFTDVSFLACFSILPCKKGVGSTQICQTFWRISRMSKGSITPLILYLNYRIKTSKIITRTPIFLTKQVVWTFRKFFFLQFDTKFASKQQRFAKIDTILWLLLSTQISHVWFTTGKIRGRKGQYYQAHIAHSWLLSTTARFATKSGLIQIQTGMHWWRKWIENHF